MHVVPSFRSLNIAGHSFLLSFSCKLNLYISDFVFPLVKQECPSQIIVLFSVQTPEKVQ